ncbi:hypothetical protein GGX14DRAFT_604109 [Mycena pura]|uniref:Uncharacterized protein n=1 Tax=Mycena pura TaxID=153505 RepID=A0AAD6UM22_9AGAR|nr:hypothetical protein GGX14DRAFT_604109 [Mycena pura]
MDTPAPTRSPRESFSMFRPTPARATRDVHKPLLAARFPTSHARSTRGLSTTRYIAVLLKKHCRRTILPQLGDLEGLWLVSHRWRILMEWHGCTGAKRQVVNVLAQREFRPNTPPHLSRTEMQGGHNLEPALSPCPTGRPPPFARGCISQDPPPYRMRNLQNTSPDRSLNQEFIYGCSMSALASTAPHARVDYTCPPFNCRASLSARRVVGGISTLHCVTARDWALFTSQYNSVMLSFSFVFHLRHATATHLGPPGLDSMHVRTTSPISFSLWTALSPELPGADVAGYRRGLYPLPDTLRSPSPARRSLHDVCCTRARARAPSRRLCRKASRVRGRDHSPPRVLRTNWTFVDVGRTRRGVGRRMKHMPRGHDLVGVDLYEHRPSTREDVDRTPRHLVEALATLRFPSAAGRRAWTGWGGMAGATTSVPRDAKSPRPDYHAQPPPLEERLTLKAALIYIPQKSGALGSAVCVTSWDAYGRIVALSRVADFFATHPPRPSDPPGSTLYTLRMLGIVCSSLFLDGLVDRVTRSGWRDTGEHYIRTSMLDAQGPSNADRCTRARVGRAQHAYVPQDIEPRRLRPQSGESYVAANPFRLSGILGELKIPRRCRPTPTASALHLIATTLSHRSHYFIPLPWTTRNRPGAQRRTRQRGVCSGPLSVPADVTPQTSPPLSNGSKGPATSGSYCRLCEWRARFTSAARTMLSFSAVTDGMRDGMHCIRLPCRMHTGARCRADRKRKRTSMWWGLGWRRDVLACRPCAREHSDGGTAAIGPAPAARRPLLAARVPLPNAHACGSRNTRHPSLLPPTASPYRYHVPTCPRASCYLLAIYPPLLPATRPCPPPVAITLAASTSSAQQVPAPVLAFSGHSNSGAGGCTYRSTAGAAHETSTIVSFRPKFRLSISTASWASTPKRARERRGQRTIVERDTSIWRGGTLPNFTQPGVFVPSPTSHTAAAGASANAAPRRARLKLTRSPLYRARASVYTSSTPAPTLAIVLAGAAQPSRLLTTVTHTTVADVGFGLSRTTWRHGSFLTDAVLEAGRAWWSTDTYLSLLLDDGYTWGPVIPGGGTLTISPAFESCMAVWAASFVGIGLWRCRPGRAIPFKFAEAVHATASGLSSLSRCFFRRHLSPSYTSIFLCPGCNARRRPGLHARALALHRSALLQRTGSGDAHQVAGPVSCGVDVSPKSARLTPTSTRHPTSTKLRRRRVAGEVQWGRFTEGNGSATAGTTCSGKRAKTLEYVFVSLLLHDQERRKCPHPLNQARLEPTYNSLLGTLQDGRAGLSKNKFNKQMHDLYKTVSHQVKCLRQPCPRIILFRNPVSSILIWKPGFRETHYCSISFNSNDLLGRDILYEKNNSYGISAELISHQTSLKMAIFDGISSSGLIG